MRRPHLLLTAALAIGWTAVAARMFSAYRLQTLTGPIWAVADDMYISASFARSLVEGDGQRWMVGAGFVARRLYYGDWLPNTYYLKATGWPLRDRLAQGLLGSFVPLVLLLFVVLPCLVALREHLTRIVRPVLAALLTYFLALLSSIELGGDFIYVYGQNRFTSVGTVYLAFALVCMALEVELSRWRAFRYAIIALIVSSGPVWILHNDGAMMIANLLDLRRPPFEPDRLVHFWSTQGKQLREVSEPGARIAVCGAGAVIYFSHRGRWCRSVRQG